MKKIKLTCSWCDDTTLYERFNRVYISEHNQNPDYIFTDTQDYDYLVIINGPRYSINFPKEKTLGVIMEPSNSPTVTIYQKYLETVCNHILWHHKQPSSQYVYYPGLLPFHMDYNEGQGLDYYINTTFKKTKLCSFIVSYNNNNSFPGSIYKERVEFAKKILDTNLDIDLYGNNWEDCPIKDSRIKGSLQNKKDGLLDYKFSIAIENCVEQDYFTEKLTDCILTDTVPIYYGCLNAHSFFSTIPTLSSLQNVEGVSKLLNQKYCQLLDKTKTATKYNLYTAIVKYFNICSNQN